MNDQNVEPGDVVGHHERRSVDHRLAQHPQMDAPQRQKLQRPDLHAHFPLLGAQLWKAQVNGPHAHEHVPQAAQEFPEGF